jgi:DNA-binding transcriptional LysR family regulator
MELRQLAALLAVADHGSFSAAAAALNTVQSNVSSHVARLERELGVALVDRRHGCALTEEGGAAVERARRVAAELSALVADMAALQAEVVGEARVGMIGTTARWLAPRLIAAVAERHPRVHLVVADATTATLEPQLADGTIDVAVVNYPTLSPDVDARALFDEDLVLVLPSEHPRAREETLALADLDGMAMLLPAPGTALRLEIDDAARSAGVNLVPKAELDGVRLMASLTFDGYGPAILPATAVPERRQEHWRVVKVAGLPRRQVGVAVRRRVPPGAPVRAVLALLDDIVAGEAASHHGLHPPSAAAGPEAPPSRTKQGPWSSSPPNSNASSAASSRRRRSPPTPTR